MGKLKKNVVGLLLLVSCIVLSGCGCVNYAPGKAYVDAVPCVTAS